MKYNYLLICLIIALSVVTIISVFPFCVSASTDDTINRYSEPFIGANFPNQAGVNDLISLTQKAFDIGLFGGNVPIITTVNNSTKNVEIIAVSNWSGSKDEPYNDILGIEFEDFALTGVYVSTLESAELIKYVLSDNGAFVPIDVGSTGYSLIYNNVYVILDIQTGLYRQITFDDYIDASMPSAVTVSFGLSHILGAYDQILNGGTIGGDGYDDGYTAGYDDGYDEGYADGRSDGFTAGEEYGYNDGYSIGYDLGYETGFDDGWETGYQFGRDQGYDEGHSAGYNEGFDIGYETGYDDGYDDGYEYGEFVASPITIDVPSVITSVPQSAKSIINNAFGFELFGINVAGLLSVLLIVAIIGFVVRWLMSK